MKYIVTSILIQITEVITQQQKLRYKKS